MPGAAVPVAGLRLLRKSLGLARVGVDSPPETRLRLLFGRSGLPAFEPNYVLLDEQGTPLWIDLACPEFRLAVEYDGGHHLTPASSSPMRCVTNAPSTRAGGSWSSTNSTSGMARTGC